MWAFMSKLLETAGFPRRWDCGVAWTEEPSLGWLHIGSDIATSAAYFAVPLVVAHFVQRRRNLKLPGVFYVFVALIFFSCGTGHLVEATIFWWPGKIVPGSVNRELGSTLDLISTFAKLSGAKLPADRALDSYDLSKVLIDDRPSPRKEFVFYRNERKS